jgi:hypothetical protein
VVAYCHLDYDCVLVSGPITCSHLSPMKNWLINNEIQCFLSSSLPQEHIESENARLDREGQFWSKEIVVKIEYKYCPNLTIIDTPGLISAAPGKRNSGLQNSSRQVEQMVRHKMEQKEYIILCLEDSNDWSNATTRRLVMQVSRARFLGMC